MKVLTILVFSSNRNYSYENSDRCRFIFCCECMPVA